MAFDNEGGEGSCRGLRKTSSARCTCLRIAPQPLVPGLMFLNKGPEHSGASPMMRMTEMLTSWMNFYTGVQGARLQDSTTGQAWPIVVVQA